VTAFDNLFFFSFFLFVLFLSSDPYFFFSNCKSSLNTFFSQRP